MRLLSWAPLRIADSHAHTLGDALVREMVWAEGVVSAKIDSHFAALWERGRLAPNLSSDFHTQQHGAQAISCTLSVEGSS